MKLFIFYILGCFTGVTLMCLLQINRGDKNENL